MSKKMIVPALGSMLDDDTAKVMAERGTWLLRVAPASRRPSRRRPAAREARRLTTGRRDAGATRRRRR